MNASCPQCKTVFRVDPRKVPPEGVRARCSVCGGVFEVLSEERSSAAPSAAPRPRPAYAPQEQPEPAREAGGSVAVETESPPEPATPHAITPEPEVSEQPTAPVAARPVIRFGQEDPDTRARRLARALISDVAAYHPERQEKGLRQGRLKELFQDELKKSWQEYVDKVGLDLAKSTPYFRDALNEILAKGRRVF